MFTHKPISVLSIKEYEHTKMKSIQQDKDKKTLYYLFIILFSLGIVTLFWYVASQILI